MTIPVLLTDRDAPAPAVDLVREAVVRAAAPLAVAFPPPLEWAAVRAGDLWIAAMYNGWSDRPLDGVVAEMLWREVRPRATVTNRAERLAATLASLCGEPSPPPAPRIVVATAGEIALRICWRPGRGAPLPAVYKAVMACRPAAVEVDAHP